ncbi:MAG: hypothetical protein RIQ60_1915 [Pseudomonadota bacterium]|jgi:hypothetical protein
MSGFPKYPKGFPAFPTPDALVHELRHAASHLAADAAALRARGLEVGTMETECCEVIADLLTRAALALATPTNTPNKEA